MTENDFPILTLGWATSQQAARESRLWHAGVGLEAILLALHGWRHQIICVGTTICSGCVEPSSVAPQAQSM